MAYELPTDLIRQVKMVTRADAGLSDYDPTGDLPPLPPLAEAVAAFDPSPPDLRCKNCKGRLLRGVQSVLCIYCGLSNDVPSDPISFKDTVAYRWLLESLHLDGSEMVGLTTKKSELNRGQSRPMSQVSLSDFLNVKVKWPTEMEKKEIGANKRTHERSSLNLTGVDLDNFFSGSQILYATDTPEEHPFTNNHVEASKVKEATTHNNLSFFENVQPSKLAFHSSESKDGVETAKAKEVSTPDDLSFFQNVRPAEIAAHTSIDKDDDAFSGWEATFQSADSGDQLDSSKIVDPFVTSTVSSGDQHESSKSSDPFGSPTIDLSSQLDLIFGPGKDLKDDKTQDDTRASLSTGAWNDDLWNNLSSTVSQETGQLDSSVGIQDAVRQDAQDFEWFGANQWQSNDVNASSSSTTHGDDNSFIEWNDFTRPTSVNVSSSENSATQSQNQPLAASGQISDLKLFSTDNKFEEMDLGSFSQADPFSSSLSKENVSAAMTDKFEEMDFGSFSEADPFSSSSSKENVSAAMTDFGIEVSSSDRVVNTDGDADRGPGQPAKDGDVEAAGAQQREEVERILSQMHDLSFMLKNNLSLPPKSNNPHSQP